MTRLSTADIETRIAIALHQHHLHHQQGRVLLETTVRAVDTSPDLPTHIRYKPSPGEARGIPLMGETMAPGAIPGTRPGTHP